MRVVMVSDLHIEGLDDPTQLRFVDWLDALQADELVLLGDLFHHWWGWRGAVSIAYVPVCAALLRLRARGVRLAVVPGNHDFALGPFFRDTLGADVRGWHAREIDGTSFALAHGDEADRRLGYVLTRMTLRGRFFAAIMRGLGPAWGTRLLCALAGRSRSYPAPRPALLDAQRRWAIQRLSEGASVVVLGHSHSPGVETIRGGQLIRLGDWSRGRVWLDVVDGQPRLVRESEG